MAAYSVARREAALEVEERGVAPPATGTRSLPCKASWGMEFAEAAAVGAGAGLLAVWRLGEGSTLRLEVGEEEEEEDVVVLELMGAVAALPS